MSFSLISLISYARHPNIIPIFTSPQRAHTAAEKVKGIGVCQRDVMLHDPDRRTVASQFFMCRRAIKRILEWYGHLFIKLAFIFGKKMKPIKTI